MAATTDTPSDDSIVSQAPYIHHRYEEGLWADDINASSSESVSTERLELCWVGMVIDEE